MEKPRSRKFGIIGAILLAAIMTVGGFALTDAMTVPTTSIASEGQSNVVPVEATAVDYTLDAADRTLVTGINVTLDNVPVGTGEIFIRPVASGSWYSCTIATPAVCAIAPSIAVDTIDQVQVVAAD